MNHPWFLNAIVYAVDVGRFRDADNDGLGDFTGLLGKLDYIQELGVDCLSLRGYWPAPNRGDDVSDHRAVDPALGGDDGLDALLAEARQRGLKVVLELVLDRTSVEHTWVHKARVARWALQRDFFHWSKEAEGPSWTYDERAKRYLRGAPGEADLNLASTNLRREFRKIARHWAQRGVDGLRIGALESDVAGELVEELPPEGVLLIPSAATAALSHALEDGDGDPLLHALAALPDAPPGCAYGHSLAGGSRHELAFSLLFTLPGTPVLHWGQELGIASGNAMQWTGERGGGFSARKRVRAKVPLVAEPPSGYEAVNVEAALAEPHSLLNRLRDLIRIRHACPEIGLAEWQVVDLETPEVLMHRFLGEKRSLLVAHNLSAQRLEVVLAHAIPEASRLAGDAGSALSHRRPLDLRLGPFGYLWLELPPVRDSETSSSEGSPSTG